jgi:hypothetical protein
MSARSEWLSNTLRFITSEGEEPTSLELRLQVHGTGAWRYCSVHEDPDLPYDYANYSEVHAPRMSKEEFYAQFEKADGLAIIVYYERDPGFNHTDRQRPREINGKMQYCFQRSFYR